MSKHQLLKSNTTSITKTFSIRVRLERFTETAAITCHTFVQPSVCSGALNNPPITQTPRFLGLRIKSKALFLCTPSNHTLVNSVQWYKVQKYNEELHKAKQVKEEKRISFVTSDMFASLSIIDLRTEDRGVYFCKIQDKWGPGSELRVASKNSWTNKCRPT